MPCLPSGPAPRGPAEQPDAHCLRITDMAQKVKAETFESLQSAKGKLVMPDDWNADHACMLAGSGFRRARAQQARAPRSVRISPPLKERPSRRRRRTGPVGLPTRFGCLAARATGMATDTCARRRLNPSVDAFERTVAEPRLRCQRAGATEAWLEIPSRPAVRSRKG